jgi:hypothetical protein
MLVMTAAGVIFAGGVAAAATGTNALSPLFDMRNDAGPPATVLVETTTTTIGITATGDDESGLSAEELEAICESASNHGEAVSAVAQDKSTVGAAHGAAVSEMAQSDCGKTDENDDDTDVAPDSDDESGLSPEELEAICESASNHGEAVSAVAQDKSTVGAAHGAAVSEMAQSDCGKTDENDDENDDEETTQQAARENRKKHNTGNVQGS